MKCIGDVDFLIAQTDELVFDGDFPVFPSDKSGLAHTIKCQKIEPYDRYPGFIRLRIWGELNFNWKYKKYQFNLTADTNSYAVLDLDTIASRYYLLTSSRNTLQNSINGPAVRQPWGNECTQWFDGIDIVKSMWCPQWPKEAQGWLSRPRNSRWPTTDTVMEVMQNGCHVVCVKHRFCRDDKLQWRFSFSLAEVILLKSWTPKQQIVYHLLRFFAKKELIQKDCPKVDEVLCRTTYHLKTLMLWAC